MLPQQLSRIKSRHVSRFIIILRVGERKTTIAPFTLLFLPSLPFSLFLFLLFCSCNHVSRLNATRCSNGRADSRVSREKYVNAQFCLFLILYRNNKHNLVGSNGSRKNVSGIDSFIRILSMFAGVCQISRVPPSDRDRGSV